MKQTSVCCAGKQVHVLYLTAIKIERATTVTHRAKDPSLQESCFLVEWENAENATGMAIRVAIVAVLMATEKICWMEVHSRARTEMPVFS